MGGAAMRGEEGGAAAAGRVGNLGVRAPVDRNCPLVVTFGHTAPGLLSWALRYTVPIHQEKYGIII
eukprot:scaffold226788_cov17-Tisochrysis_lutea.AAC.1